MTIIPDRQYSQSIPALKPLRPLVKLLSLKPEKPVGKNTGESDKIHNLQTQSDSTLKILSLIPLALARQACRDTLVLRSFRKISASEFLN